MMQPFLRPIKNDATPASGGEKVDWEGEAAVQGQEEVSHLNDNSRSLGGRCFNNAMF